MIFSPNLKADIESNSLENAQKLADAGIIQNNSTNTENYKLKNSISRREMLKIMINLSWNQVQENCEWKFADLPSSDWWCKYAETALKLWYISANKYFRPDDNVSKAESLKMIFKAKWIDVEKTTDWRVWYVNKATELWYSEKFYDYDNASLRSFVFDVWAKTIDSRKNTNDLMCLQVITPAINKETWECVNFPNSCIPAWFEKTNKCESNELNYKKSKLIFAFNEEMNEKSVLSNLKVYPELNYTTSWRDDDKTLELTLNDLIDKELDVLVNVMDDATTKSWEKVNKTISKKYKIDWNAIVDFVSPEWQLTDKNGNITVRFSKPIVSLTNLDNQEKCPITITPNIDWKCVWITTSTFQFRPEKGFPAWARYTVFIPSWIETISWDKTILSKAFEIVTPEFKIENNPTTLNKDDKLNFLFNDEVSLTNFKNNFSITWIEKSKLSFEYLQVPTSVSWSYETNKNWVSVFPTSWYWWYNKNYTYNISKNMKSERWNIWLEKDISVSLTTNDFLSSYNWIIFLNDKWYFESNLKYSNNKNIITKTNPKILFRFYENVPLDKSLFSLDFPFELDYIKSDEYVDWKIKQVENKSSIVMSITWNIQDKLKIKLNTSKISLSEDKTITLSTKDNNQIISYNQINYKKACIESKYDLGYYYNWVKDFEFNNYWKVNSINKVESYTNDSDCKYEWWKNKYIVQTSLNPESDYKLTIKKSFLDSDNYPLDKDYNYSFKTWLALNEDKNVEIIDNRSNILVPKDINPLSISLSSVNLSKAQIKVCNWDLDITNVSQIKNETCETKTINLKNLWFKSNLSVIDLESIYSKEFSKNYVKVEVEKLTQDKADYEKKEWLYIYKASFVLSNISATLKSWSKSILWLRDFRNAQNLNDEVEKIESYKYENGYSFYWWNTWEKWSLKENMNFKFVKDWLYQINWNDFQSLLITLKSWEQVFLWNIYNFSNNYQNIHTYISTDKPIYKTLEKVNIKWVSRILKPEWYELNTWKINVIVRDSKYKEIYNKDVQLSDLWSFDINIDLKNDASLGNYYIYAWNDTLSFAVEEYEKPDFKVEIKSWKENYLMNENASVEVFWDYYVWMPMVNWEWTYKVDSSKYYFDWWKTTWYIWWENEYLWWRNYYNDNTNQSYYKNWEFTLDSDWKYTIWFELNKDSNIDKIYNVSTTITDPNTKKSISSNTSFIWARSETFLWMKFDKYYYDFKDTANIWFVATDIKWNKKSNIPFKFTVYKVNYDEDWTQSENIVKEQNLTTDNSWVTDLSFTFDNYWEYRFEIETVDWKYKTTKTSYVSGWNVLKPKDANNKLDVVSSKEIYDVWEKAEVVINSPVKWVKALFTIEKLDSILYSQIIDLNDYSNKFNFPIKKEYLPNFNVWIYVIKDSSFSEEKLNELKNIRAQMLKLEQKLQQEKDNTFTPYLICDLTILPSINDEDLDKDDLTKLAELRFQEQDILSNILPEYYIWNKDIKVNTDNVKLNIKATTDKNSYLPWDKQTINLEITDDDWNPISGELTLKIIDESLLALKNNSSDILNYFYSNIENSVATFWNLENIIKRIDFTSVDETSTETSNAWWWWLTDLFWGVYAEEAAPMAMDMAMDDWATIEKTSNSVRENWNISSDNSTKIRTEFKDLAFYNWKVDVKSGKAKIVVQKLPDNLTTWVISWFASTNDTKVWNVETKFKVQKDLSILPQIPRFFTNWDIANIWWLIVNNTSKDLEITTDLNITNASSDEKSKTILVKANSSSLVEFNVEISTKDREKNDITNIILTAKNSDNSLSDTIILEKPIYPNDSWEYVFTNWSTEDLSYEEKINLPSTLEKNWYLEFSLWASILTNVLQNLDKYLVFPSDDLYSKLSFLETSKTLKNIYTNAWKLSDFENIKLTDYEGKTYKVSEVESLIQNDLKNYLQDDNWFSYYKNCETSYYYPSCSSFSVTWKYLELWIEVDWIDNKKVLSYYENELKTQIEKNKALWVLTTWINEFLPIATQKDSSFIKTYFKPNENLSNIEKLEYLKLYRLIWENWNNSEKYLSELKNSLLIEARWTFLPSWNWNNSYSTSLMLETLIENWKVEKLESENLARWILSQRNEDWIYYLNDLDQILKSLNLYLEKVEDIKNVSFTAKAYLNWNDFMTWSFDDENKFSIKNEKFDLDKNIIFWQDNSLGFEKTWTWKLYYDVWIKYFLPTSKLEARDEWLIISRNYYNYKEYENAFEKKCFYPWWWSYKYWNFCNTIKVKNIDTISKAKKWDLIVWEIELVVNQERTNVVVKDFLPAWAEILNTNFDTTSSDVKNISWNNSNSWYSWFDYVEQKNDMVYLYASHLNPWTYKYTYVLKASYSWKYSLKPATAELLDKWEIWWRSKWVEFEIE